MESADELEPPDAEFYAADHGKRFGLGESDRRVPGVARLPPGSEAQILVDENDLDPVRRLRKPGNRDRSADRIR